MYMKYSQGGKIGYTFCTFIAETEDDIPAIKGCGMGSKVYVITTGESWMLDNSGKWYPFKGDKDPIECDCVSEMTIWNDLPAAE